MRVISGNTHRWVKHFAFPQRATGGCALQNGDNKVSTQELFVTLAALRKSMKKEDAFASFLDSLLNAAKAPETANEKPALTEVLLTENF